MYRKTVQIRRMIHINTTDAHIHPNCTYLNSLAMYRVLLAINRRRGHDKSIPVYIRTNLLNGIVMVPNKIDL